MIFNTFSLTDRMFESSSPSIIEQPLSDERDLSQIDLSTRKNILKRQQNCTNDMYTITNRYHRLKPTTMNTLSSSTENLTLITTPINQSSHIIEHTTVTMIDERSIDSIWSSSGITYSHC